MGILNDVSNTIKELRELATSNEVRSVIGSRNNSLSRKGSEGTLQFPNICSRALSIDHAIMINKALERQYAVFTQITLSLNPYLDLSKDRDVSSYLKKIHQNHRKGFLNTMSDLTLENDMSIMCNEDDSLEARFIIAEGTSVTALKDQKDNLYSTMDYVNENCLNDLYIPKEPMVNFNNSNLNVFFNNRLFLDSDMVTEASSGNNTKVNYNKLNYELKEKEFFHKKNQDKKSNSFNSERLNLDKQKFEESKKQNDINNKYKKDEMDMKERHHNDDMSKKEKDFLYKQQRDLEQDIIRRNEFNAVNMGNTSVKMTDSECKKANELVPTTLAVSLNVKEHGNFGGTINFVLGIKTILHPVTSDEMIRNLVLGCKNSSKFFKFIKWTTGEIKFFKDFLLNMTEIRTDVLNTMSNKESGWWTSLKRRRQVSDLKKRFGNGLMPNAAITLSMDEVQLIRSNYGYDLTDPKLVTKIMKDYFLLSFIIVDPSQEIALFLFDGEDHFQTMSFAGLERENNNKNDFKEIYKLINSGRL